MCMVFELLHFYVFKVKDTVNIRCAATPHSPRLHCSSLGLKIIWVLIAMNCTCFLANASWSRVLMGTIILIFFTWSLARTLITHPGLVPTDWLEDLGRHPSAVPHFLCEKSGRRLPPRSYFVYRTGEAYLHFDHYCELLATPIGLSNRRFFLLFTMYASATSLFGIAFMTPLVTQRLHAIGDWHLDDGRQPGDIPSLIGLVVTTMGDFAAAFYLFGLAGQQWYFVLRNRTSVDPTNASYSHGLRHNLEAVFGPCSWTWVLPLAHGGPDGDGLVWASVDNGFKVESGKGV